MFDKGFYLSCAKWLCRKGPYLYFATFIFCMLVIVIPSVNDDWKLAIMGNATLRFFYEKFSSLGYWVTIPMMLMVVTHAISTKLRNGVFPGGWRYDFEGIEPNPCIVVERNLLPENLKEELVFWIWVIEGLFMKIWGQLILSGLFAYIAAIARSNFL